MSCSMNAAILKCAEWPVEDGQVTFTSTRLLRRSESSNRNQKRGTFETQHVIVKQIQEIEH